jgi:hypothetical protein
MPRINNLYTKIERNFLLQEKIHLILIKIHGHPMKGSLNDDSLFQNTKIYYTTSVCNF